MANDAGLRYGAFPITSPGYPPALMSYKVETSATLQYFRGQFVVINSNGRVQPVAVGISNNLSALGVVWNFEDVNLAGLPSGMTTTSAGPFLPVNTDAFALVTYDPMQLYVMEEITGGTAIGVNSIGLGVDFTYTATTGNTTTGFATTVLQNVGLTNGTANTLQLVNVLNILNQDATVNAPGASCKWVVRIQRHVFGNAEFSLPQGL